MKNYFFRFFLILLVGFLGCHADIDVNEDGNGSGQTPENAGTLKVLMTDNSGETSVNLGTPETNDIRAIFVTVDRVEVHTDANADFNAGGWIVVSDEKKTINLMELAGGVRQELGLNEIPEGNYTQMRLVLGNTPEEGHSMAHYFVNGTTHTALKVPSGLQSGIKLVGEFSIEESATTELLLNFDAERSIVIAGNSGQFLLKPVIRICGTLEVVTKVQGKVTHSADQQAIAGASVTAQIKNADGDPEVFTSTTTDSQGNYSMDLAPGDYTLVASAEGFHSQGKSVMLDFGEMETIDFALEPVAEEDATVTIILNIPDISVDLFATIHFHAKIEVDGVLQTCEVASVNLADGGTFIVNLPAGDFHVDADVDLQVQLHFSTDITLNSGQDLEVQITF